MCRRGGVARSSLKGEGKGKGGGTVSEFFSQGLLAVLCFSPRRVLRMAPSLLLRWRGGCSTALPSRQKGKKD